MNIDGKDLGVKIGSKEENNWSNILKQSEEQLVVAKANIEITEAILALAKKRAKEEKEKFNKK